MVFLKELLSKDTGIFRFLLQETRNPKVWKINFVFGVTWMIQAVEYSYSLWNGKQKCLDLEFPNHMIGCKGYFWRGDGFNRIWVSSTKHGDTIDLHWVLTINPFNFEITSWSQLNHWISFVFCRFCHVLSLLKRTQQPLDPFDSPQVSWKPRSSSTSASRSCVARG